MPYALCPMPYALSGSVPSVGIAEAQDGFLNQARLTVHCRLGLGGRTATSPPNGRLQVTAFSRWQGRVTPADGSRVRKSVTLAECSVSPGVSVILDCSYLAGASK